jgi:molybdopterin synthase catalytic subunit
MTVRVQSDDFDMGKELRALQSDPAAGAIVSFTGIVRDTKGDLIALELEHYPAMTTAALQDIVDLARSRWTLSDVVVIHRFGRLAVGEQIMMVATSSAHRADAFAAAEYIMDYLKTDAPFWKKEHTVSGGKWVDARNVDKTARDRWIEN